MYLLEREELLLSLIFDQFVRQICSATAAANIRDTVLKLNST